MVSCLLGLDLVRSLGISGGFFGPLLHFGHARSMHLSKISNRLMHA
jgi:hypothetical protein